MNILEVRGLNKHFGGLRAVRDLSFDVVQGEVLGLIGPNGSGKSTTLSLLMGIVKADAGSSMKLDGRELCGLETYQIARYGLSMVFQHSRPLMRQTILENIEVALLPDRLSQLATPRGIYEKAHALGVRVGLGSDLQKRPGELPYASLRRLELARAIAREPKLCLLDEPFAGLAPRETEEFSELIDTLRREGWSLILVDHNVQAVAKLVDRLVVMNSGAKIAEGEAAEIVRDPEVRQVYFGRPDDDSGMERERTEGKVSRLPALDVAIDEVRYGSAVALHDVHISAQAGEFVSVVGLNGAGKTTLFDAIMGFKDFQGHIRFEGKDIGGSSTAAVSNLGLSLCPETRELFRYMTVKENLEMGGHALSSGMLKTQIERIIYLFPRLGERLQQQAMTLSGGEQQMLTIGRALMRQPKILLLDEPTLGLAPLINQHISDAMFRLQSETELTIILAEQNLTFALKHSNRIYFLQTGEIRWSGPSGKFMAEVGENIL